MKVAAFEAALGGALKSDVLKSSMPMSSIIISSAPSSSITGFAGLELLPLAVVLVPRLRPAPPAPSCRRPAEGEDVGLSSRERDWTGRSKDILVSICKSIYLIHTHYRGRESSHWATLIFVKVAESESA